MNWDSETETDWHGLAVTVREKCIPEEESYEDVYGEPPPEGCEFWCLLCEVELKVGAVRFTAGSSLGFVETQYGRGGMDLYYASRDDVRREALTELEAELERTMQGGPAREAMRARSLAVWALARVRGVQGAA